MRILKRILLAVLVALLISWAYDDARAGDLSLGLSYVPASHSEQVSDRCMNDGYAIDVGYTWTPVTVGILDLGVGLLGTYSNIESAYRVQAGAPESQQDRESIFTMLGVVKPGIKLWRVKTYLMFGAGGDWSTHESFDSGHLTNGYGMDIQLTDDIAVGFSARKFDRAGTFYKYQTVNLTFKF